MSRILVTAFEPFGDDTINPSQLVLEQLPDRVGDHELIKAVLEVDRHLAVDCAVELITEHQPAAVVSLGQSGRPTIDIERVFVNLFDGADGEEVLVDGGPLAHRSTLPAREICEAVALDSVTTSLSAGAFVCNALGYELVHRFGGSMPTGFVHLPFLPGQRADKDGMGLDSQVSAVTAILERVVGLVSA